MTTTSMSAASTMTTFALRLRPGDDLTDTLDTLAREQQIEAACVLTCVGSLRRAVIRLADQEQWTVFDRKFEIVSLTGVLSRHGSHYHIALADSQGKSLGGHIGSGCEVYTTAEIVLGVLPQLQFLRELDETTGYPELSIRRYES